MVAVSTFVLRQECLCYNSNLDKMPMSLRIFYIAILLLLLSSSSVFADYIQGHVVWIDREQGVMEIVLCDVCVDVTGATDESSAEKGEDVPIIKVVASWFPLCISEGVLVFARGVYSEGNATVFKADDVFPYKRLGNKDKTGVRSRFRHKKEHRHHTSSP